jgi:hypothetical protein
MPQGVAFPKKESAVTVTTRRRVLVVLVALVVMVPLEALLLRAWAEPDPKLAIRSYVANLDAAALDDAAGRIQSYPLAYRREILRVLNPARRAEIWRGHIAQYINDHPGLDSTALVVLEAAMAMATPEVFGAATAEHRRQIQVLADQTISLIGREEADYLFYRLGPRDGRFTSAEPWSMRFTNWVRGIAIAMAEDAGECSCNTEYGCDSQYTTCRASGQGGTTCTLDEDWPACGWFWNQTCDGVCATINPQD